MTVVLIVNTLIVNTLIVNMLIVNMLTLIVNMLIVNTLIVVGVGDSNLLKVASIFEAHGNRGSLEE